MPVNPKDKATSAKQPAAAIVPTPSPDGELVDLGGDFNRAVEVLPKLDTSAPFLLAYHPQRWDVVEGYCVPALATVVVEAGINNVENVNRNGQMVPDWTEAAKKHTAKGGTIIPHSKGPGGRSYMQRVKVKGGFAHLTVFATAIKGSDEVLIDGKGYADWIGSLFADGTLTPPPAYVLRNLRTKYEQIRDTYADRAHAHPSAAARVRETDAKIKAIDDVIGRFGAIDVADGEAVELD